MKNTIYILSIFFIIFMAGCEPAQISLNGDKEIEINVNDNYVDEGATLSKGELITKGEVNNNKVGTYIIRYENEDGDLFVERTVTVNDNVSPVINLYGESEIEVELGTKYLDPGAMVQDNYDKSMEVEVTNNVDTSKEGVYEIIYEAVDSSGNEASESRQVTVYDPIPKIILNGDSEIVLFTDEEYTELGATAYSSFGREIEVEIEGDVENTVGTYEIKYHVTNEYGNYAELVRTVRVAKVVDESLQFSSKLEATDDGGYLILTENKLALQKFKNGEEIFNLSSEDLGLTSYASGNTLIEDSDSNIIIAFNTDFAFLKKLNSEGEKIWSWKRPKADILNINHIVEADYGYFYIGYVSRENLIYGLVDKEGNFKWEKTYKVGHNTFLDDVVYYNNELYLLLSTIDNGRATLTGVKVTKNGEWNEYSIMATYLYDMTVSEEYGVIAMAHDGILKVGDNFSVEKIIDIPNIYSPYTIKYLSNGTFIIIGSHDMYNISSSGDVLFNKNIPEPINIFVDSSVNDNDLLVTHQKDYLGVDYFWFTNLFG